MVEGVENASKKSLPPEEAFVAEAAVAIGGAEVVVPKKSSSLVDCLVEGAGTDSVGSSSKKKFEFDADDDESVEAYPG